MRVHAPADGGGGAASPSASTASSDRHERARPGSERTSAAAVVLAARLRPGRGRVVRDSRRSDAADAAASVGEVLPAVSDGHLAVGRLLSGLPAAAGTVRRPGRRGRRNAAMLRIANERISSLFVLAGSEAQAGQFPLSDRYVALARRIGTRYNVRLLPEYRELYCRGCSAYWVEGRTVRTRIRQGRRVRACLRCGRIRRVPIHAARRASASPPDGGMEREAREETARVPVDDEEDGDEFDGGGAEEE